MCHLIFSLCPTCSKVAAHSRVKKCADRANPLMCTPPPCIKSEIRVLAKNPCISCTNPHQEHSNTVRVLTRDILEETSLRIPEWRPTPPPKDHPILPKWTVETLTAIQTEELFFNHITRHHCVEINRQDLPSQRKGIPLCLVAGVAGGNRKPARPFRRPQRSALPGTSRQQGSVRDTIDPPPSALNKHRRISHLGMAPAPPLTLQIPVKAPASAQLQATDPTPTSAQSEHLIARPSPQAQRFSAVSFAQVPSHYDLRPVSTPTPQQRVQEHERHETLNLIRERGRERQERERQERERQELEPQRLEPQRIRDFQQRDQEQRPRSEVSPPRTVNDVQSQSVRPLNSKRSLRLIPRLRSFSPLQGFDAWVMK